MPLLVESCEELFLTDNLYEVLGVTKESTKQKNRVSSSEKETATKKFQILSQVYNILSDDGRRAEYDETGSVGEEISADEDKDWEKYWRLLFPKVTLKDIEEFSLKYKGSDEELEDLKKLYLSSEGDIDIIMSNMMCSCHDDEHRFVQLLADLIKEGSLLDFPAFSKESNKKKTARMRKAQAEAKEAEEEAKKLKLDNSGESLLTAIAQRQASRAAQADDFLSHLEAKYASGAKKVAKGRKKNK
uniref:J domain-containing protein n=1 Tax=Arion vulgaris TaxID=1028688 RepID=A0A0B7A390_9EUPU